ncbi:SusD/RagB family nutrient-binding outer membrane lipoprotein [Chitinophaga silvatica]|uniref:SusD/RagB family nutrient-binding outer membrane lipoprotein n=1 Tax=Chitinophaga silvatica TaxID=2282649 RepID=A0A3E1Y8V2_9BACT|nr:SusD/RagB family nutrient-binding outer membrane lipoprotein [Chitinophaga silvatica]RFS21837.1 SusD/RagB family nutrient-binding outer membrane lipoprotein [Chitinophaga silvatica]
MKRLFIYFSILMLSWGCTRDFAGMNIDNSQFSRSTPEASILAASRTLVMQLGNMNTTRFWDLSHLAIAGSRYDVTDNGFWGNVYQGVLGNLNQVELNYSSDSAFRNRVQIARILKAYTYSILTGIYGPVPRTQANNLDYLSNVLFDNEDSVYVYALSTLKDAVSKMNASGDKLTYDVIYNGDISRWIKLANSWRLKIALNIIENQKLKSLAEEHIRDVMSNESLLIGSESETAKMPFETVSGNENPYYQKYIKNNNTWPYNQASTSAGPKMSEFFSTYFRSYSDPRMKAYYDTVPLAYRVFVTDTLPSIADDSLRIVQFPIDYLGMPLANTKLTGWNAFLNAAQGVDLGGSDQKSYSNVNIAILQATRPFVLMSYAEVLFLKAEAAERGLGGGSAETYYNQGIAANFSVWGITTGTLNSFMQVDGIKWGTEGNAYWNYLHLVNTKIRTGNLNKIYAQRWLNYFPDGGFDCWCLQRRTQIWQLPPHTNPGGYSSYSSTPTYADIPGRGSYPTTVTTLNPEGYNSGLKLLNAVGGNDFDIYTKLHFAIDDNRAAKDWNNRSDVAYDNTYLRATFPFNTWETYLQECVKQKIPLRISQTYKP